MPGCQNLFAKLRRKCFASPNWEICQDKDHLSITERTLSLFWKQPLKLCSRLETNCQTGGSQKGGKIFEKLQFICHSFV